MLGHCYSLLFLGEAPPQITSVGGVKDRPKKRPKQSAFFARPMEITQPAPRNDDDELMILMALGAL